METQKSKNDDAKAPAAGSTPPLVKTEPEEKDLEAKDPDNLTEEQLIELQRKLHAAISERPLPAGLAKKLNDALTIPPPDVASLRYAPRDVAEQAIRDSPRAAAIEAADAEEKAKGPKASDKAKSEEKEPAKKAAA